MPTLLRLALGALVLVYLSAAAVVPAVFGHDADPVHFGLWTVAFTAIGIPPLLAGIFVSYWSWDRGHAARIRRTAMICAAVQGVGVVGILVASAVSTPWLIASGVTAIVAVLVDAAAIGLGRAARRAEQRRGDPAAGTQDVTGVAHDVRAAWRRAGIGAVIGFAITTLGLGALWLLLQDSNANLLQLVPFALAAACLGAEFGLLTKLLTLSRRIREIVGREYGAARHVGRIVVGKESPADDAEALTAARYAAVMSQWLPIQITSSMLIFAAIALNQLPTLTVDARLIAFRIVLLASIVVAVIVLVPLTIRRTRKIRAYAAANPVAA